MASRMVTLCLPPSAATLTSVRAKYALGPHDVDHNFGVTCISPEKNLYAILVTDTVADRIEGSEGVTGAFSNPKIETFGPPR